MYGKVLYGIAPVWFVTAWHGKIDFHIVLADDSTVVVVAVRF